MGGRGKFARVTPLLLACLAGLLACASAHAATVTDRLPLFSFDGSDSSAGSFRGLGGVAVDQADGSVYVLDLGRGAIDKFGPDGQPQDFAATGTSSLSGEEVPPETLEPGDFGAFALGGPPGAPSRIYVGDNHRRIDAFSTSGQFLWQQPEGTFGAFICGMALDAEGHLWVVERIGTTVHEFAATGAPPAEVGSLQAQNPTCDVARDRAGNVFLTRFFGGALDRYSGDSLAATLESEGSVGIAVDDRSPAGHLFSLRDEGFNEYDASGALLGAFATERFHSAASNGIAYDPTRDRVYVASAPGVVTAFAPPVTGTVPDSATQAPTGVGIAAATFHGTVNPQGLANSYRFQWKPGTGPSWQGAQSSAAQPLPGDSSDHPVSFATAALRGNTTYQVRLEVENTDNHLRSWSALQTFTTSPAPAPPAVGIDPAGAVGTNTAEVTGTIDPQGDTAEWSVQLSAEAGCSSGFADQGSEQIGEAAQGPQPVSFSLSGLLPSQHYCARIVATNSAGTTTSEVKQFDTETAPPSGLAGTYASPRLDTSVRLDARVDPEGEILNYRFEYSKDGGGSWSALPEAEDTSQAREQIVVGEELTGLTPGASYLFRFSAANPAGALHGEARSFATRTSTEVAPPGRGIELVNSPDKGNQNVFVPEGPDSPLSENGEAALWLVNGGAPGGSAPTGNVFLARRTSEGWRSQNLVPPPAGQIGEGSLTYVAEKFTPDFRHFLFSVGAVLLGSPATTVVRLDGEGHQEVLGAYENPVYPDHGEITDDGAHAVIINPDDSQLEEVGPGRSELISVMPDGAPSRCGLASVNGLIGESFAGPSGNSRAAGVSWHPGYRMMEASTAARVYFEAKPDLTCEGRYGLYERSRESGTTALIDPGGHGGDVEFIRSTPDGRHAWFVTVSRLDPADHNRGADAYRWDEASETSTCLTCVVADADLQAQRPVMVSDDFSHVYFQSHRQLVPGEGEEGSLNTYALSNGRLRWVGGPAVGSLAEREALLSSDGETLVFRSASGVDPHALTADLLAAQCASPPGRVEAPTPCQEIYRYDDRDGSMECISCAPDGVTTFNAGTGDFSPGADFKMSSDGQTIAFATMQALVPRDVDQTVDVYEWRDGAVHLITDGARELPEGRAAPHVWAVSGDGRTVLFSVALPGLTGFEQDGLSNLYAARIGGGFEVPGEAARCTEDSCQGPLAAPPDLEGATSTGFVGRGNLRRVRRCAHRRIHRRHRCAEGHRRRHARHRHRHGRHMHRHRSGGSTG